MMKLGEVVVHIVKCHQVSSKSDEKQKSFINSPINGCVDRQGLVKGQVNLAKVKTILYLSKTLFYLSKKFYIYSERNVEIALFISYTFIIIKLLYFEYYMSF